MRWSLALILIWALPACGGAPNISPFPTERPPSSSAVGDSAAPTERPRGLARLFSSRKRADEVVSRSPYGAVCGDPLIRGEVIPPVPGRIAGCGIPDPVKVYEVEGVALSTPATINCNTALALKAWVRDGVRPAVGKRGGGVNALRVAASYSCRTRNNRPGAKLSEHSTGNAIDISAITFADGSALTVSNDWRGANSGVMRRLHRAACGPFGTVLGPDSDRFHQNHFHFDVARHRSGSYCR